MKQGTWREKLEYFWMYYKIPFLTVVFLFAVAAYFIYAKAAEKEPAFSAILLDIHTDVQEEALEEEFAEYAGIDTGKYEVQISTSLLFSDASSGGYAMASLARVYTQIGTEELDVCMMLGEDFAEYAEADSFLDLREVFTEEELEQFPGLYRDENGRVLGVYGDGLEKIEEIKGYSGETPKGIAGVLYNTKHPETAKQFLEYLLEGEG